jgi:hypothetical protein
VRRDGPKEGVLVAWGFTEDGERVRLAVMLGMRESHEDCQALGRDLIGRGLGAPMLIVADGAPGLIKVIEQCWPASDRQHCAVHRLRNLFAKLPERERERVRKAYWQALHDATNERDAAASRSSGPCSTSTSATPPTASSSPSSNANTANDSAMRDTTKRSPRTSPPPRHITTRNLSRGEVTADQGRDPSRFNALACTASAGATRAVMPFPILDAMLLMVDGPPAWLRRRTMRHVCHARAARRLAKSLPGPQRSEPTRRRLAWMGALAIVV